jgi:hypothetical protein
VNEEKGDRQKALRTLSRLIRRLFQRYRPKADIGRETDVGVTLQAASHRPML